MREVKMEFKTVVETLKAGIMLLKEELQRIQNRKRPTEYLIFKTEKSYIRYYLKNRQRKESRYISCREEKVLREYCQERFLDKLENKLPKEIDKLEKIAVLLGKVRDGKAIFEELPEPVKKFATPRLYGEKEMIESFYRKGKYARRSSYEISYENKTDRGEYVRSKSELIIANMLYRDGIPYEYERPVMLKNKTIKYPDFTVLNTRTGREYLFEHFGMMDDPEYRFKNLEKIKDYENSGYIQGINLIMSFETKDNPLDTEHIKKLIKTFFK